MASINRSLHLFFTTSPRSPHWMEPDLQIINDKFIGHEWNKKTQYEFMSTLVESEHFAGKGPKDPELAARDRITRGPKSLGFVDLKPTVQITEVGKLFISSKRKEDILLRQLLKFQLPSPYHTTNKDAKGDFWVKPYLEIFRLIKYFGSLSFVELQLFGLQLTNYKNFDSIVNKIEEFRKEKALNKGQYKKFLFDYQTKVVSEVFYKEIAEKNFQTRESKTENLKSFVKKKIRTMRDYADACTRYLRATGLINISQRGRSLSIIKEKIVVVDHFLDNVSRDPIFTTIKEEKSFKDYLFNPEQPILYTDNRTNLIQHIQSIEPSYETSALNEMSLHRLKDISFELLEIKKEAIISNKIHNIKAYKEYDDIKNTYNDIRNKDLYDLPLMFEWNTWRAMTMLNGGRISGNFILDDQGDPISTAPGNQGDIMCDYGDFGLLVEVTLSSGAKQYDMEGESVSRHLGKFRKEINKDSYCLFIAPKINENVITHFFTLYHLNLNMHGGYAYIVPLSLDVFEKMVEDSYKADTVPTPHDIKRLFEYSKNQAKSGINEVDWFEKINEKALSWLD